MTSSFEIIDSITQGPIQVDILQWNDLTGMNNPQMVDMIFYLRNSGLNIRQVRLKVNKSAVILEAGSMQFHSGRFSVENRFPIQHAAKRILGRFAAGEKLFRPEYSGKGVIWLEPSFMHFLVLELDEESIIVDQGMFLCCSAGIEVTAAVQTTVSAAILGGEGLFQTRLKGSGFVVLESPVGTAEIIKHKLRPGERIVVDGSFALMRSETVRFSVRKSARTLFGTATSGEGLVQTFEGEGEVWLAPMLPVYAGLSVLNPFQ